MASPLRAPILLTTDGDVPQATADASTRWPPGGTSGCPATRGRPRRRRRRPHGRRTTEVGGNDVFDTARQVDALQAKARGKTADDVLVVSSEWGVRDARRRVGGEVRAPHPLRARGRGPGGDRGRAEDPRAAADLAARARGGRLREGREGARAPGPGDAHPGPGPRGQLDRLRPLHRGALRVGRSTPGTGWSSRRPSAHSTPPRRRRSARPGPTARCCSSRSPTGCRG